MSSLFVLLHNISWANSNRPWYFWNFETQRWIVIGARIKKNKDNNKKEKIKKLFLTEFGSISLTQTYLLFSSLSEELKGITRIQELNSGKLHPKLVHHRVGLTEELITKQASNRKKERFVSIIIIIIIIILHSISSSHLSGLSDWLDEWMNGCSTELAHKLGFWLSDWRERERFRQSRPESLIPSHCRVHGITRDSASQWWNDDDNNNNNNSTNVTTTTKNNPFATRIHLIHPEKLLCLIHPFAFIHATIGHYIQVTIAS